MKQYIGITFSDTHLYSIFLKKKRKQLYWEKSIEIPSSEPINALQNIKPEIKRSAIVCTTISHKVCRIQHTTVDSALSDEELMRYIATKVPTPFFDYQVVKKNRDVMQIKVVSASEAEIHNIQQLFQSAKIRLSCITPNLIALQNIKNSTSKIIGLPKTISQPSLFCALGLCFVEKANDN